jgi:hypothetical protein
MADEVSHAAIVGEREDEADGDDQDFLGRANGKDIVVLTELIEADKIKPVIGSRYRFARYGRIRRDLGWARSREGRHHGLTRRPP